MNDTKKNKFKILKVKDKSDKFVVEKEKIFDLPMRLLLVMRTGGGKSNLIVNFFRPEFYGNDFFGDDISIVSPMINDNKLENLVLFKEIPDDNVITEFDTDILEAWYDKNTEEFKERVEAGKKAFNKIIIIDDFSFSGKLREGQFNIINKIFCNGRKHNISIILTSQFYNHILPSCRSQATGIIIGNQSDRQLDIISDDNNFLKNKKEFKTMFRKYVKEKHDFLVINYSNKKSEMYLDKNFNVITEFN